MAPFWICWRATGHTVHPTYPALTPIVQEPAAYASLSGVSLTVRIRARWNGRDTEATGGFLFTHRGYSGPAVLDVSHVAVRSRLAGGPRATLRVRWSPLDADAWQQAFQALQPQGGLVLSALAREIPSRLSERILADAGVPAGRRAAEFTRTERQSLIEKLTAFELPWTSRRGIQEGRSHRRRRGAHGRGSEDAREPPGARPVPVRRNPRRVRPDRRPQLRVGVGDRASGGIGCGQNLS